MQAKRKGRKYVYPIKKGNLKWRVTVWDNERKKSVYVGSYYDLSDAISARNEFVAVDGVGKLDPTD